MPASQHFEALIPCSVGSILQYLVPLGIEKYVAYSWDALLRPEHGHVKREKKFIPVLTLWKISGTGEDNAFFILQENL